MRSHCEVRECTPLMVHSVTLATTKESPDYEASVADMMRTFSAINMLHGVDADPIVKGKARQALAKGMKKKRKRISDLWTAWFDDMANGKTERVQAKYEKYRAAV